MARPGLTPRRLTADDLTVADALDLMRAAFAYMDGRIEPPSSIHRLDLGALRTACTEAEVWALGHPLLAVVVLTPRPTCLYLGKLAVDPAHRGEGLARILVDHAATRAAALGLSAIELEVRIELTDNQQAFVAMGFSEVARTAHPGFGRPTSITMRRTVSPLC